MSMVKKHGLTVCCLQETNFTYKDTQIKSKWIEKNILWKHYSKEVGKAVLISDRTECKVREGITDKGEYYIMIQGSIL